MRASFRDESAEGRHEREPRDAGRIRDGLPRPRLVDERLTEIEDDGLEARWTRHGRPRSVAVEEERRETVV